MGCGASASYRKNVSSPADGTAPPPESQAIVPAVSSKEAESAVVIVVPQEPKGGRASPTKRQPFTQEEVTQVQDLLSSKAIKGILHEPESLIGENAILEYAPGLEIVGNEAWDAGRLLVLSGSASIVANCECNIDTQLAVLQPGSIFGWTPIPHSPRRHTTFAVHPALTRSVSGKFSCELPWDSLRARVKVDSGQSLRVCELDGVAADFLGGIHQRFSKTTSHDVDDSCRHLSDLWESTSAPSTGIGIQPAGSLRAQFLTGLWGRLRDVLEAHDDEIRRRKRRGYRTNDQFPLQGHQIAELKEYVLHLTEVWYGSSSGGNLSAFFHWFMKAMDLVEVTAYLMDDIPTEKTPDGWAVVVDGGARAKALKDRGNQDATHIATGGMKQKQGRSAIDNTVLVNVFSSLEARVLLIGRRLRKVVCRLISIRQSCILRRLSLRLKMNLLNLASEACTGRDHRIVRSILRALSPEDFEKSGIDPESFCFRELLAKGCVISGFGQLEPKDQVRVWDFCSSCLCPEGVRPQDVAPKMASEDVFDRFVLWSRDFPGEFFERNKHRHFEVLIGGMWCNRIMLVKRSAMERMTLARYFAMGWTRSRPLWAVLGGTQKELREAGTKEASRVRANECPYARFHGMSLPSGGFALDERRSKKIDCKFHSLMIEMQWVQDPAANIENWFLTDIEKIVQECWQLNPHGPSSIILPGEMFVNVGQNPKVGSSIKQTQHTQICEGSLLNYPILQMMSPEGPKKSTKLCNALLDFIDIGPQESSLEDCGFFLKVICVDPTQPAIVAFLVDLRLSLLANFGGAEVLDFLVTAVSDGQGRFVILFAPIPHLEKIGPEPADLAEWANPVTGDSSRAACIEEARLDFGKGVGQFLVNKPALREQLLKSGEDTMRRIWAFNRVPGLREFVQRFAVEQNIFG